MNKLIDKRYTNIPRNINKKTGLSKPNKNKPLFRYAIGKIENDWKISS